MVSIQHVLKFLLKLLIQFLILKRECTMVCECILKKCIWCLEYEFIQCPQEEKSQCICDRKNRSYYQSWKLQDAKSCFHLQKHKEVTAVFLRSVLTLSIKVENSSNNELSLTKWMLMKASKPASSKLVAVHKTGWGI